jgi:hypothetical protein
VSHFDLMLFQVNRKGLRKEIRPHSVSQQCEYFIRFPPELKYLKGLFVTILMSSQVLVANLLGTKYCKLQARK